MATEITLDEIWQDSEFYDVSLRNENENDKENENEKENELKCLCDQSDDEREIIECDGDLICDSCGLILKSFNISFEAEWRCFNTDEGMDTKGHRVGNPIDNLIPQTSMSTGMTGGNVRMKNLNMWLSIPYKEKILLNIRGFVTQVVNINRLPPYLIGHTVETYKKFSDINENCFRGKNRKAIIGICFYYSSKHLNLPISYICKCFDIDKNIFNKYCKVYNEHCDTYDNQPVNSVDLLERFGNQLGLSFHVQKLAKNILIACEKINLLPSVGTQTLVSSVFLFINQEMQLNMDKEKIVKVCNVSITSMVKFYKIITKEKLKIFNYVKETN